MLEIGESGAGAFVTNFVVATCCCTFKKQASAQGWTGLDKAETNKVERISCDRPSSSRCCIALRIMYIEKES